MHTGLLRLMLSQNIEFKWHPRECSFIYSLLELRNYSLCIQMFQRLPRSLVTSKFNMFIVIISYKSPVFKNGCNISH